MNEILHMITAADDDIIYSRSQTKSGLTNFQLKDLYSNCIKLSTENVSVKTAVSVMKQEGVNVILFNIDVPQSLIETEFYYAEAYISCEWMEITN